MNCSKSVFVIVCLTLLLTAGCARKRVIRFYSPDKSQCITVINQGGVRYIINGEHGILPKSGFVQLDVEGIDPIGDGLHICWRNENYEWEVTVHKSKIIKSKLDTSKYKLSTNLPIDERGIPTEIKFRQDGCAVFSFSLMRLSPDEGAIVEY